MSTPFIAEVKMVSFNFAPKGWAQCDGALLPINQNQALFSLLGTTFGGNGQTTFGLPDLRGRTAVHTGGPIGAAVGGKGGEEAHTLVTNEMPAHTHALSGVTQAGSTALPTGNYLGASGSQPYRAPSNLAAMDTSAVSTVGNSQGHENRSPFAVVNFCIALVGIFPSRN